MRESRESRPHRERLTLDWRAGLDPGRVGGGRGQDAAGLELLADLAATAVQAGHDRADRSAHDLGDLAVGVALDVGQVDRGAELVRQPAKRPEQPGPEQARTEQAR